MEAASPSSWCSRGGHSVGTLGGEAASDPHPIEPIAAARHKRDNKDALTGIMVRVSVILMAATVTAPGCPGNQPKPGSDAPILGGMSAPGRAGQLLLAFLLGAVTVGAIWAFTPEKPIAPRTSPAAAPQPEAISEPPANLSAGRYELHGIEGKQSGVVSFEVQEDATVEVTLRLGRD